jgi:leucyl aminopeptidase (aminopeptidase T)
MRARTPSATLRLSDIDFDLVNAARRVIEGSLGVVAGERVVIVVDASREPLGNTLAEIVRSVGAEAHEITLDQLGDRPMRSVPATLIAALEHAQASVLLIGFEDGERAMRLEFVARAAELRLRHAHMVGVGRRGMLVGFSVDPARILVATRAVRMRLRPASVLRLRSAAGSQLEVKLDPKYLWQERLGLVRPGRWETLPSGELFTSPGEVNGVFVADASIGEHFGALAGVLCRAPVRVEIKAGTCRTVQSADRSLARAVEDLLDTETNSDRVGLVGLGTNVGMSEPTGEILCDKNLPGLHLSFGTPLPTQTGATWDASTQLAMAGTQADVDLDGVPLVRQGRYLIL